MVPMLATALLVIGCGHSSIPPLTQSTAGEANSGVKAPGTQPLTQGEAEYAHAGVQEYDLLGRTGAALNGIIIRMQSDIHTHGGNVYLDGGDRQRLEFFFHQARTSANQWRQTQAPSEKLIPVGMLVRDGWASVRATCRQVLSAADENDQARLDIAIGSQREVSRTAKALGRTLRKLLPAGEVPRTDQE